MARPASRPLRVVMVIQRFRPDFSGQGVQVEALCRALARRGVDATILTTARAPELAGEERAAGYRIERLRCDPPRRLRGAAARRMRPPLFALSTFAWLWRRREAVDLIHVHALTDALYASWLFSRSRRVPLLFEMTLLGADDAISIRASRNLFPRLRYGVFRRCDGYVAISPALARAYREEGLAPERLRVIPQGVDLEAFRPAADRGALRAPLGLPADTPVFAFVGSLVERKGIDVLLAAWSRIHAREPRAHLLLVGRDDFAPESPERLHLERHLALLGPAAATVHRRGVRADPQTDLQAADLFLFPSRREGFGTAIIEAMACGLPAVVAELPGITDFIFGEVPGETGGVVVPQEDPEALAGAALDLLGDPSRARAMGEAARRRAADRFGLEAIAGAYLEFYQELLERVRGR